jgi:O-Antigen ligase
MLPKAPVQSVIQRARGAASAKRFGIPHHPEKPRQRRMRWAWPAGLVLIHLPLGIVMKHIPLLATLHGLAVLLAGLVWIVCSRRQLNTALVVAYISGAELLWRISGGSLFWEFGKIAVILLCLVGIMKAQKLTTSGLLMVLYFLALLPALLLSDWGSFGRLKDNVSMNLSGPASLAMAGVYFSGLRINHSELKKLLLAFLLPTCSVSAFLLFSVATARDLNFTGQSNFTTSGGFGPVQVSSFLAAGCLLAYLFSRLPDISSWTRRVAILVVILWLGQVALTFSRSGIYIFCGSALASIPFLLTQKLYRRRLLEAAVLCAISVSILLPFLLNVTGGKLEERFSNTATTGRADMAFADWESFKNNPITGLGLGGAGAVRLQTHGSEVSSHTELTRLLSEHGLLGAFALLVLVGIPVRRIWQSRAPLTRALILSSATYSFLFMATCGMRLVVVSFIYGLALMDWTPEPVSRKRTRLRPPAFASLRLSKPQLGGA